MRKLIPILLLGLFLQEEIQAQCNPAFDTSINGATIQLQALDTGLYTFHSWKFGDGTYGWGAHATHTYNLPGTYVVKHYVVDSLSNCRDSAQQTIIISFTASCAASFTAKKDSINSNRYYFYSTSTVGGGSIQSYKWTVNGDSVSSAPTFNRLLNPGFNLVCLAIKTTAGCRSSKCDSIYVDTTGVDTMGNCNWSPSFTYTVNPSQPNQYAFTAVSSDTVVIAYHWMIQSCDSTSTDSVTYNTANPVHTFTSPGCYRVCLHLLTLNGCRKSYCDTISVNYSQAAGFVTSFPNPVQGAHVQLRLDLVQPAKVKITVFNSFGHSVYTYEKAYGTGQNRVSVPVDKLQRGLYYIDIQYGNNRKRSVFQKL